MLLDMQQRMRQSNKLLKKAEVYQSDYLDNKNNKNPVKTNKPNTQQIQISPKNIAQVIQHIRVDITQNHQ